MRAFALALVLVAVSAAADKWVAPLAPRPVTPPRAGVHPIDSFRQNSTPIASDAVFARRAYLDLWGLLPTPEQLTAFLQDRAASKRERLIDTLLAHNENYSAHWITFWNDLLRNDEGVVYHGERKSITPWLKRALEHNLPYNQFVAKLLNPSNPGDPDGFLTGVTWRGVVSASELPPMQAAQNSAQIFLGINLKCNSCHDSFISRWKLADAYGLASFFSEGPLELVRCDVKQGKTAETKFLFPELGPVPQGAPLAERRAAAVRLFTTPENGRFTRTYVNRIWAALTGKGLVPNVDDMAARPTDPDLLDWLANDFAAHNYDSKHLLRTIMTSQTYQAAGVEPRRLSAEQFLDSIAELTGEWRTLEDRGSKTASYAREWRFKSNPLSRALGRPIRDQVTTVRLTQPTTLQALELVNGTTLNTLLHRGAQRILGQLAAAPKPLFDSGPIRGAKARPQLDLDLAGRAVIYALMLDVDSYDPAQVRGGFFADGFPELASLPLNTPVRVDIKNRARLDATAALDPASTTSDINGAVRFFIYAEPPDLTRLVPATGPRPVETPAYDRATLVNRLYTFALSRPPSRKETEFATALLGPNPTVDNLEDLLWTIVVSPEFGYIR